MSLVTNTHRTQITTAGSEFERETKWCEACNTSVRFLMSVHASYCVDCGGKVRMFRREESLLFAESVQRHKYQAV